MPLMCLSCVSCWLGISSAFPPLPTAFGLKYHFPWTEANYQRDAIETDKTDTLDPNELLHCFPRKAAREIGVLFVEYFSLFQGHLVPFFMLLGKNAEQAKLGRGRCSFSFSHDARMGEITRMEKMKIVKKRKKERKGKRIYFENDIRVLWKSLL